MGEALDVDVACGGTCLLPHTGRLQGACRLPLPGFPLTLPLGGSPSHWGVEDCLTCRISWMCLRVTKVTHVLVFRLDGISGNNVVSTGSKGGSGKEGRAGASGRCERGQDL